MAMKLLVFAHTPPPHHGQSYMVKLMLDGLGGDARRHRASDFSAKLGIKCYHVNARFSQNLSDIGEFQGAKLFLIIWFCLQAIWLRFRYGVTNFYYVPAPGKKVALYRDWLVMFLCRPFFKKIILHWHAAGMAKWLETSTNINVRAATYRLFRPVNLSIVISRYNIADAEKLLSRNVRIVNNGIPDPCPDFEKKLWPWREERYAAIRQALGGGPAAGIIIVKVFFLAHCTHEKGVFAAAEAVLLANQKLANRQLPLKFKLAAAGNFVTPGERQEFRRWEENRETSEVIRHEGFVEGARKEQLLREADLFLFPTQYMGENQPVNLIEAMAFGLPIVTTRWRSLPEMFPPDYAGLVKGQNVEEIAEIMLALLAQEDGRRLRQNFENRFVLEQHLTALAGALRTVEAGTE